MTAIAAMERSAKPKQKRRAKQRAKKAEALESLHKDFVQAQMQLKTAEHRLVSYKRLVPSNSARH